MGLLPPQPAARRGRGPARETGLILQATFEHEFIYSGATPRRPTCMPSRPSVGTAPSARPTWARCAAAGVEVDSYIAEFAPGQFEVSIPPRDALAACDTRRHPAGTGACHGLAAGSHMSASRPAPRQTDWATACTSISACGTRPATRSAMIPSRPSASAQRQAASCRGSCGTCRRSAPSPHLRRFPTFGWCRMPGPAYGPTSDCATARPASASVRPSAPSPTRWPRQFNFEFRAADATANPYLQLAMILRAGLAGIREELPTPTPDVRARPREMSPEEREARSIVRLPSSVDEAFAALDARRGRAGLPAARAAARLPGEQGRRDPADRRDGARGPLRALCRDLLNLSASAGERTWQMGKLDGRVAIVTGAATGLGRGIARLYAGRGRGRCGTRPQRRRRRGRRGGNRGHGPPQPCADRRCRRRAGRGGRDAPGARGPWPTRHPRQQRGHRDRFRRWRRCRPRSGTR